MVVERPPMNDARILGRSTVLASLTALALHACGSTAPPNSMSGTGGMKEGSSGGAIGSGGTTASGGAVGSGGVAGSGGGGTGGAATGGARTGGNAPGGIGGSPAGAGGRGGGFPAPG